MNFLARAFSEPSGKPSSHRMMVGLACGLVLGTWCAVSLERKELQAMDTNEAAIVVGALGVGAWKRGREGNLTEGNKAPTGGKENQ